MTRPNRAHALRVLSILTMTAAGCTGGGPPGDDTGDDIGDDTAAMCTLSAMGNGVSTLTGCSAAGMADGARGAALFANPVNVAVADDGKVYVADFDNGRIRVVSQDGVTTTLTAQDGFARPFGLAFAADGALYAETDNNPQNQHSTTTGTLWTIDRTSGEATALAANLGRPRGMVVLADGRLVVSDYMHHVVQLFNPTTHVLSPLAGVLDVPGFANGTGNAARFDQPYGIVDLGDGSVAVADLGNNRIRRVSLTGVVTTLAGTGTAGATDGAMATATFSAPQALAIDGEGTIYVTDTANFVVRRIKAGTVDTVAGNGSGDYLDSDDPRAAGIFGLEGLAVGTGGELYIADGNRGEEQPHDRIRRAMIE